MSETVSELAPTEEALKVLDSTSYTNKKWLVMHDSFYAQIDQILQRALPKSRLVHYSKLKDLKGDFRDYERFLFSIVERDFPAILHAELVNEGEFFRFLKRRAFRIAEGCKFENRLKAFDGSAGVYLYKMKEDAEGFLESYDPHSGILFKGDSLVEYDCLSLEVEVLEQGSLEFKYLTTASKPYFPQSKFRLKHLEHELEAGMNTISVVVPRIDQLKLVFSDENRFKLKSLKLGRL